MGDFDSEVVLKAARALAKRADPVRHAGAGKRGGTVISAVMFGALAGLRHPAALACRLRIAICAAARRGGEPEGLCSGFDAAAGSAPGETGTPAQRSAERI